MRVMLLLAIAAGFVTSQGCVVEDEMVGDELDQSDDILAYDGFTSCTCNDTYIYDFDEAAGVFTRTEACYYSCYGGPSDFDLAPCAAVSVCDGPTPLPLPPSTGSCLLWACPSYQVCNANTGQCYTPDEGGDGSSGGGSGRSCSEWSDWNCLAYEICVDGTCQTNK